MILIFKLIDMREIKNGDNDYINKVLFICEKIDIYNGKTNQKIQVCDKINSYDD